MAQCLHDAPHTHHWFRNILYHQPPQHQDAPFLHCQAQLCSKRLSADTTQKKPDSLYICGGQERTGQCVQLPFTPKICIVSFLAAANGRCSAAAYYMNTASEIVCELLECEYNGDDLCSWSPGSTGRFAGFIRSASAHSQDPWLFCCDVCPEGKLELGICGIGLHNLLAVSLSWLGIYFPKFFPFFVAV